MSWTNARSQKFLFASTILFFALVLAHIFFPFGYEGRYKLNSQEVRETMHILKAYDENYSKIIRGHKYKDNDKDNAKTKNRQSG